MMRHSVATGLITLGWLLATSQAFGQSYDPLYPPAYYTSSTWFCYEEGTQNVVPNCDIVFATFPYNNTNGHFHNSNRPSSALYPTSGNTGTEGLEVFFGALLVGQAEYLEACADVCVYFDYGVGYGNIYWNEHTDIWVHVGATTNHGSNSYNHWMELDEPGLSSGPAYDLYYTTLQYLAAHEPQTHICTNDMALPFAGKFDLNSDWSCTPGVYGHCEHDRGDAVDVPSTTAGSCTSSDWIINITEFLQACGSSSGHNAAARLINEGNHAHCGWRNPNTYPH